jgi:hypothetical protein
MNKTAEKITKSKGKGTSSVMQGKGKSKINTMDLPKTVARAI